MASFGRLLAGILVGGVKFKTLTIFCVCYKELIAWSNSPWL